MISALPRGELVQIGQVAERTGLSLRTIRFYEENGLVVPTDRTGGGVRLYGEDDVARLEVIKRMKPLGFTLEEMKDLLAVLDALQGAEDATAAAELRAHLAVLRASAVERRAKLIETLARADEFIDVLGRY